MTNREYDIYKLQTIIFTLVVAAEIVVGGASSTSRPSQCRRLCWACWASPRWSMSGA